MNFLETCGLIACVSVVLAFLAVLIASARQAIIARHYNAICDKQLSKIAMAIRLRREGRFAEYADIDE